MQTSTTGQSGLTIGKLAREAGIHVETVRYYERIGLIEQPATPAHGYRQYPRETLQRIAFIKRAQKLGFSLDEIAELLQLGSGNCVEVKQKAELRRSKIERQIRDLQALSQLLGELIEECEQGDDSQPCPIVQRLLFEVGQNEE